MSKFHFRGFTSILLGLSFIIVVATGLVLWLSHSPQTLGITKGTWKHVHIFVSLLMATSGIIHLCVNWSVFACYLWERTAHRMNQKRELALAVAIVGLITCTAFLEDHGGMQQVGKMSLKEISTKAGKSTDEFVALLKQDGIAVHDPADSLMEIAEHNKISPPALLTAIQRHAPEAMRPGKRGDH